MAKRYYLMKDGRKIQWFSPTENLDLYVNSGHLILNIKVLNLKVDLGVIEKVDYDFKSKQSKKNNDDVSREDLEAMLFLFYEMLGK